MIYLKYINYIMKHKLRVFKYCIKSGLITEAFTHDISKFSKYEFKQYAQWFYGEFGRDYKDENDIRHLQCKKDFDKAWRHHYSINDHHWNYWVVDDITYEMSYKAIKHMICDLEAMGDAFGNSAIEFYYNNRQKIKLHPTSRIMIEYDLGLIDEDCRSNNISFDDFCKSIDINPDEYFSLIYDKK